MGTKSLTYVYDGEDAVVCVYGHMDGYPSGLGADLADFLSGFDVVNGFGRARRKLANGMGCLAAQLVAHLKTATGGFYLLSPKTELGYGEDYSYHIYKDNVSVKNHKQQEIFSGTWREFARFCTQEELVCRRKTTA